MNNNCRDKDTDSENITSAVSPEAPEGTKIAPSVTPDIGAATRFFEGCKKDSRYHRSSLENGGYRLISKENSEEKYTVSIVSDPDSALVDGIVDTLNRTFKEGEVANAQGFRRYLKRKQENPGDRGYYMIVAIRDEKGEVKGFLTGMYASPEKTRQEAKRDVVNNQGVLMIGYVVVDRNMRNKGFMDEMYQYFFEEADRVAALRGEKVGFVAGEAVDTVEKKLNVMGRARSYIKTGAKSYEEIKYLQPPLQWNFDDGHPNIPLLYPEHLMIASTDGRRSLEPAEIGRIVESLRYHLHGFVRDRQFTNEKARERAQEIVVEQAGKPISEQLEKSSVVRLLSAAEREQFKNLGFDFKEVDTSAEIPVTE